MTGLEKMLSRIREEAAQARDEKLAAAKAQADEILAAAQREAEESCRRIAERTDAREKDLLSRADSAAELMRLKTLLAAKQEIISSVTEKAYRSILDLSDEEYFSSMAKLAKKHAQSGKGVMFFSAKDLARLPADFEAQLSLALEGSDKSLTVSRETRTIDGGFILAYGSIEENCSLRALFDADKEAIQDEIGRILFG